MSKLSSNTVNKFLVIGSSLLGILSLLVFDYIINLKRDREDLMITDENGFYQPAPNLKTKANFGKFAYSIYTDENGYRISIPNDDKRQQPRSQTCPTIYFIGDSFTWGSGLNHEQSYPGLFEKSYSGKVVNMGVESHSPTAYLERIRRVLKKNNGSELIVIAGIDISDVQGESSTWTDSKTFTPQTRGNVKIDPKIKKWIGLRFKFSYGIYIYLKNLIANPSNILPKKNPNNLISVASIERSAFTHKKWNLLKHSYAPLGVKGGLQRLQNKVIEMSNLVHNGGGSVYLLEYPWPAQVVHPQKYLNWPQFINDLCDRSHCSGVIETTSYFSSRSKVDSGWYQKYYLNGDMHFNALGYQVLSVAIKNKLRKSGPEKCLRA